MSFKLEAKWKIFNEALMLVKSNLVSARSKFT